MNIHVSLQNLKVQNTLLAIPSFSFVQLVQAKKDAAELTPTGAAKRLAPVSHILHNVVVKVT